MARGTDGNSATTPGPVCDLDRLAHGMEAHGMDGLVITTDKNTWVNIRSVSSKKKVFFSLLGKAKLY